MWQVAMGWHIIEFAQTSAILEFYVSFCSSLRNFYPNRGPPSAEKNDVMSIFKMPRNSATSDFRGTIMGTTSYRLSVDTIAPCEPMSRPKDWSSNTCCNFWPRILFRYKHCLFKRFNFSVHKTASTVKWRVLEDCYDNRFSWYTAVKQLSSNIEI